MNLIIEEVRFIGGFIVGVGGAFLAWHVGPAVAASGWTSAACVLGLLGAAGAVGFAPVLNARVDPVMHDPAVTVARGRPRLDRQADRPRDWLRDNGIDALPREQTIQGLRARLAAGLTFHPIASDSPFDQGPRDEASALLAAFAALSGGSDRRGQGKRILRSLAKAHSMAESSERATALVEALEHGRGLMRDPTVKDALRKAFARHATRETLAMGLLTEARRHGAVVPNEFGWLRDVQPGLWYALDNVGRRTFHVEGLAAMDHFAHEELAGHRLATPNVDMATRSLLGYLAPMRKERVGGATELPSEQGPWDEESAPMTDLDLDFGEFALRRSDGIDHGSDAAPRA